MCTAKQQKLQLVIAGKTEQQRMAVRPCPKGYLKSKHGKKSMRDVQAKPPWSPIVKMKSCCRGPTALQKMLLTLRSRCCLAPPILSGWQGQCNHQQQQQHMHCRATRHLTGPSNLLRCTVICGSKLKLNRLHLVPCTKCGECDEKHQSSCAVAESMCTSSTFCWQMLIGVVRYAAALL